MTLRVGVAGATGKMGRAVGAAVSAADGLELVAATGRRGVGEWIDGIEVREHGVDVFAEAGCDVVVDFTTAEVASPLLPPLVQGGTHVVSGTTGLASDVFDEIASASAGGGGNCVWASNFSVSAVVMMRCAAEAARHFDTAEIIELHHDAKVDAPSGTAITTAERMAEAMDAAGARFARDPTERLTIDGARGARGPGGIPIHAVRMRGMVAHQEVILGAQGQTLTIRQDSYDRTSYMPGVLLAVRRVGELPGLTLGLDSLLD